MHRGQRALVLLLLQCHHAVHPSEAACVRGCYDFKVMRRASADRSYMTGNMMPSHGFIIFNVSFACAERLIDEQATSVNATVFRRTIFSNCEITDHQPY